MIIASTIILLKNTNKCVKLSINVSKISVTDYDNCQ